MWLTTCVDAGGGGVFAKSSVGAHAFWCACHGGGIIGSLLVRRALAVAAGTMHVRQVWFLLVTCGTCGRSTTGLRVFVMLGTL